MRIRKGALTEFALSYSGKAIIKVRGQEGIRQISSVQFRYIRASKYIMVFRFSWLYLLLPKYYFVLVLLAVPIE